MVSGMLMSAVGCLLISFGALTTPAKSSTMANQQITETLSSVAGQLCTNSESLGNLVGDSSEQEVNYLGISFIFLGLFLAGFGNTVYFSLSVSYLDDNVSRQFSPIVLAASLLVRLLGPFFGMGLASICLRIFVNPLQSPSFNEDDPRWIGAWWIGPPLIALLILVMSLAVMLFPTRLPILDSTYCTDASSKGPYRILKQ